MKMPSIIINPITIAWKTPIDSLRTVADIIILNMGVNENTLIVFTVPMCFRLSKNRNSAPKAKNRHNNNNNNNNDWK